MSSFSSGTGGSVRWTAPELYAFGDKQPTVTMYSDVYSFGCVALEVRDFMINYLDNRSTILLFQETIIGPVDCDNVGVGQGSSLFPILSGLYIAPALY